jgi:hypothetical protein
MGRRARATRGLALAMLGAMVTTAPVGAWDLISDDGTTGAYEIEDQQDPKRGANCLYETASKDLDKISVRGPQNVHGAHSYKQWIGYRFVIQRNAPPTGDDVFSTIPRSPILYAKADDNENPYTRPRRTWTAPETTSGFYRVRVILFWYTKGSHAASAQTGKVVIQYEWYKQKWDSTFDVDQGYCSADYT